jgi:nicotinamidase/pyrazinamidase
MKALILKNLQNDFLDTGALPLEDISTFVKDANEQAKKYDIVIAIQKWYPADHVNFAASHPWRKPGQTITIEENEVVLQIIHCVADSLGAALVEELNQEKINYVIRDLGQGSDPILSEINRIVKEHKIEEIDVMGPELP